MPPDFFTCGGMAAASAVVTALTKTGGSTDTEKLIATMEGMEFDTPKGKMIFRKEDHQALQSMYVFKVKADDKLLPGSARPGARHPDCRHPRCRSATSAEPTPGKERRCRARPGNPYCAGVWVSRGKV